MLAFGYLITQDGQYHRLQMDIEQSAVERDQLEQKYQQVLSEWKQTHTLGRETTYQNWLDQEEVLDSNSQIKDEFYSQSLADKNKIYRSKIVASPLRYVTEEMLYPLALPNECGTSCYMIGDSVLAVHGSLVFSAQLQDTWAYVFESGPTVVLYHPERGIKQSDFSNLILSYRNKFYISDQGVEIRGPDYYQTHSFIRITATQVMAEWRKSLNKTDKKTCKASFKDINQYCEQLTQCNTSQFNLNNILKNGTTEEGEERLKNFEAQLKIEALTHLPGLNQKQLLDQCSRHCNKQSIWYWSYKRDVCELSD